MDTSEAVPVTQFLGGSEQPRVNSFSLDPPKRNGSRIELTSGKLQSMAAFGALRPYSLDLFAGSITAFQRVACFVKHYKFSFLDPSPSESSTLFHPLNGRVRSALKKAEWLANMPDRLRRMALESGP
jgi:hypothetical protein